MAAYTEGGIGVSDSDRIVKRGARGHESGRGESFGSVEFSNGAIDAGGEPKVVRVDDET